MKSLYNGGRLKRRQRCFRGTLGRKPIGGVFSEKNLDKGPHNHFSGVARPPSQNSGLGQARRISRLQQPDLALPRVQNL